MEPNRLFREARLASGGWNLFKSIVQMVVFWTVFLVVLPALLYFAESAVAWQQLRFASSGFRIAGVFLFLLGGSLGISSCFVMALIGRGTRRRREATARHPGRSAPFERTLRQDRKR